MSSATKTNYYEVLGVEPTATIAEIKQRYRELARKYHPDLNPGPDAAQKIKLINEAYHILGDEDKRAVYDFERAKAMQAHVAKAAAARNSQPPHPPGRTNSGRVEFNGFGTVQKPASAAAAQPTGSRSAAEKLMHDAQLAFISLRYSEAERLCRQALSMDAKLPTAHEMMGDIFSRRNQTDLAVKAYTYALQYNPHNAAAMAKMQRLTGLGSTAQRPSGPQVRRSHAAPPDTWRNSMAPDKLMLTVGVASIVLFAGICALVAVAPGPLVLWGISLMLPLYLFLMGGLSGLVLAIYGGLGSQVDELTAVRPSGNTVLLTPILTISAIICYYMSLIVYFVIGFLQGKFSRAVLKMYGAAMLLTLVCWPLYHPVTSFGGITVPIMAGNLLFPGLLAGWRFGDWLRMGSSLTKQ